MNGPHTTDVPICYVKQTGPITF